MTFFYWNMDNFNQPVYCFHLADFDWTVLFLFERCVSCQAKYVFDFIHTCDCLEITSEYQKSLKKEIMLHLV